SRTTPPPAGSGFAIPAVVLMLLKYAGTPLLAVLATGAALVALKTVRRRRRRTAGPPSARVAAAWRELADLGLDLGIAPAGVGVGVPTRRELAAHAEEHGLAEARAVAVAADAAVFGPADLDDAAVAGIWQLVAAARHAATAGLPLRRRVWVAVNPVSLWASRAALERLLAAARTQATRRPPSLPRPGARRGGSPPGGPGAPRPGAPGPGARPGLDPRARRPGARGGR